MMSIPAFVLDIFAVLMLLVAAVSAGRLALDRPWRRGVMDADIDGAHLLMGIAMAGMLVASLSTLPNGVWTVIFAVMTAWFAWCVYRESRGRGIRVLVDSHHAPHLVHSAAMVYMFAAITAPAAGHASGMAGMGGAAGGMPTLAVAGAGVHLRSRAGRLFGGGPGPAVRARPARQLPARRGRRASRRRPGGRTHRGRRDAEPRNNVSRDRPAGRGRRHPAGPGHQSGPAGRC